MTTITHTPQDDFEHFLSYSGLWRSVKAPGNYEKMFDAYKAGDLLCPDMPEEDTDTVLGEIEKKPYFLQWIDESPYKDEPAEMRALLWQAFCQGPLRYMDTQEIP